MDWGKPWGNSWGVTIDSWLGNTNKSLFSIKRNQYLYPFAVIDANLISLPEVIYTSALSYDTYFPFSFSYQYLYCQEIIDITAISLLETITLDKWYKEVNQPLFNLQKLQHLYPSISVESSSLNYKEFIFLDKWYKEISQPIFSVKNQNYLYSLYFPEIKSFFLNQDISLDKWYMELSKPQFDIKREQYLYPSYSSYMGSPLLPPIIILKWRESLGRSTNYQGLKEVTNSYSNLSSVSTNWRDLPDA